MLGHVHHIDDMMRRERRIKQSLIAFELAVLLTAILWLAFYHYV